MTTRLTPIAIAVVFVPTLLVGRHAWADDTDDQIQGRAGVALEEIVVTARKREERLIDVPMAISSYSGPMLEETGVENVKDLYGAAPSVYFVPADSGGPYNADAQRLVIRGIGATPIIEPGVGIFVDGVYQPDLALDMDFANIERVELLRGPQGTLFGRNTEGGALNIITQQPGDTFEAKAKADYGSFNSYGLQGYLAGPVSARISISFAAGYQKTDGFVDDVYLHRPQSGNNKKTGRLRLVSRVSDTLSADVLIETSKRNGGELGVGIPQSGLKHYQTFNSDYQDGVDDMVGGHFKINWDLQWASFHSITGVRRASGDAFKDTDGGPTPGNFEADHLHQRTVSQEFRVESPDRNGAWKWTAGMYYFDEDYGFTQVIKPGADAPCAADFSCPTPPTLMADQWYDIKRTGEAVFGQATYTIGRWDFTAGERYAHEAPKIDSYVNFAIPLFGIGVTFPYGAKTSFNASTPMGSVTFHPSRETSVYGTIARGYKAGGFNYFEASPAEYAPFDNEFTTNYEIGVKTELLDRRLAINADLFYTHISGQQIEARFFDSFGNPTNLVYNLGKSRSSGLELELQARPLPSLTLLGSYSYTDTKYVSFDYSGTGSGAEESVANLVGKPFAGVPKDLASLSATYVHSVGSGINLRAYGSLRYVGSQYSAPFVLNGTLVSNNTPSYSLTSLGIALDADRWSISAHGNNVFDKRTILAKGLGSYYTSEPYYVVGVPREIGVSVKYHW